MIDDYSFFILISIQGGLAWLLRWLDGTQPSLHRLGTRVGRWVTIWCELCFFFLLHFLISSFVQYRVTNVMMINYLVVCQLGGGGTKQRNGSRKLCFCCWIFWVSINDQDQYSPFICNHCIARNARRIFYNTRFIEKWHMDLTNQRFQYALV